MTHIHLIACVASKRPRTAPARDLYRSPLFVKARAYVEAQQTPWFILSALYGLVPPHQPIDPYDLTLNSMGIRERQEWARELIEQCTRQHRRMPWTRVTFLAGARYREGLIPWLDQQSIPYDAPMSRLAIGQQLQWLTQNTNGPKGFF